MTVGTGCTMTLGASRVTVRALDGFFRRCDQPKHSRLLQRFEVATGSWTQLAHKVAAAQEAAVEEGCVRHVKVLFFVRHGQGYHNAAVDAMGKAKWNAEGAYDLQYVDAHLTPAGVLDACRKGPDAMDYELRRGMPRIQRCLTSPLSRAIETAACFFAPHHAPRPFVVMENCREVIDTHRCNQRRPLSELQHDFPDLDFSHTTDEDDALYSLTQRESVEQQHARIVAFLAQVCREFPETYIAVSSHADFMRSMWVLLDGERLKPGHCEVFPLVLEVIERKA